mmetsp:Transcript_21522/g.40482  ORF Transcript_21522/g.40482 Transcript_21522/m.40482 type:complete len:161 (-) Transcript_21522:4071-4553(-)
MENNDRPVEFDRLRLHISQIFPCFDEPALLEDGLLEKIERSLGEDRFQCLLPNGKAFLDETESFFKAIVEKQKETIESCDDDELIQQRTWNSCRFTETQVDEFLKMAFTKYTKALVEPGEAVGAMGAQSISEPGTQMTLKVCCYLIVPSAANDHEPFHTN